jgi:hypothetical protein
MLVILKTLLEDDSGRFGLHQATEVLKLERGCVRRINPDSWSCKVTVIITNGHPSENSCYGTSADRKRGT